MDTSRPNLGRLNIINGNKSDNSSSSSSENTIRLMTKLLSENRDKVDIKMSLFNGKLDNGGGGVLNKENNSNDVNTTTGSCSSPTNNLDNNNVRNEFPKSASNSSNPSPILSNSTRLEESIIDSRVHQNLDEVPSGVDRKPRFYPSENNSKNQNLTSSALNSLSLLNTVAIASSSSSISSLSSSSPTSISSPRPSSTTGQMSDLIPQNKLVNSGVVKCSLFVPAKLSQETQSVMSHPLLELTHHHLRPSLQHQPHHPHHLHHHGLTAQQQYQFFQENPFYHTRHLLNGKDLSDFKIGIHQMKDNLTKEPYATASDVSEEVIVDGNDFQDSNHHPTTTVRPILICPRLRFNSNVVVLPPISPTKVLPVDLTRSIEAAKPDDDQTGIIDKDAQKKLAFSVENILDPNKFTGRKEHCDSLAGSDRNNNLLQNHHYDRTKAHDDDNSQSGELS